MDWALFQRENSNTYDFSLCFFATFVLDVFFALVGMFCLDFLINLFVSIYNLERSNYRGIPKELNMKLVEGLIWQVISYGAQKKGSDFKQR